MSTSALNRRLATVILANDAGHILMQHRDASAPTSPNKWSLPGGGIEEGETAEEGARRELLEETGLQVDGPLTLLWHGTLPSTSRLGTYNEWFAYSAQTPAQQEDVILGEGQAMVFLPIEQIDMLDLTESSIYLLSLWKTSKRQ